MESLALKYGLTVFVTIIVGTSGSKETEPDTGPIFFLEPPSNILIDSVVGAMISCRAHGKPAPQMDWQRSNGAEIPHNPDYIKIHPNNSLQFIPFHGPLISSIHRTAFRCVARNKVGTVLSRSVHVKTVISKDYKGDKYNVYTQDAWVMRGNTAVFTCDIRPSFVRPYVSVASWYIGDHQVMNDERHIIFDNALHISNVDDNYNGKQIRCVTNNLMVNNLRKSSRRRTLHVINPVQTTPNIEYKKGSATAQSGSKVILPCVAHAFPIASYTWLKDGARLRTSSRIQLVRGDIEILNATSEDSGMYWCNASNVHGSDIVNTNLLITTALSVQMSPRRQKIDAGLPATLTCNVTGGPYSEVVWYKNGNRLIFNNNTRIFGDNKIKIEAVSRRDVGMYQCLVSSVSENEQASSQLQLGVSAPVFHDMVGTMFTNPGESLSLRCQVYGNPLPTVQWLLFDEQVVGEADRVKIGSYMTEEGEIISHVNISSLQITDGGRYRCVANNSIGIKEQVAQINVYGPLMVREMENKTAVAKKTLTLTCHVSGFPIDHISWSKDGRPIRMDHRINSSISGVVEIHSVVVADVGWYNCTARNNHSHTSSSSVYVSVMTEPVLEPISFPVLVAGNPHVIVCVVKAGDRPITLSWYKNNQLIKQEPDLVADLPLISMYSLKDIQPYDVGNYTCVTENRAGQVNTTAQLLTVNVKPYWITRPTDESVLLGSQKIVSCQGGGTPSPNITWKIATDYAQGEYREIGDSDISHYFVMSNGSLLVRSARLEDHGYYLCQVDNGFGPGLSEPVLLTVHVPASYAENQTSKFALVGDSFTLACDSSGDKPIATTWSWKRPGDNEWIQIHQISDTRLSISEERTDDGMSSVLNVNSALRRDSGDYWCTSKNQYGHSTRLIRLNVREEPYPVDQLTVMDVRSRGLSLSWRLTDDGNSALLRYIIQYGLVSDAWNSCETVETNKPHTSISSLTPNTRYKIRVLAVNAVGPSNASYEVVATTGEERPSGAPRNVTLTPKSCTTINITWQAPTKIELHGTLLGYRIGYRVHNSSSQYTYITVTLPTDRSVLLTNLNVNTSYSIAVSAFNGQGHGPNSEPHAVYTFEDVPSQPPTHVTGVVSPQAITVSWRKPSLPYLYGSLSGYKIIIHSINVQQDERDVQSLRTSDDVTEKLITNLNVHTNYSIQVLAYTESGDGIRSSPIYITTPQTAPGKPMRLNASPLNSSSVMLSWLPPQPANGILQQYLISVYTGPKQVQNITLIYPVLVEHLVISDLVQGQVYGFKVKAKNHQTMYGPNSDEATASPAAYAVPAVMSVRRDIDVRYHKTLLLTCPVTADPVPVISWYRGKDWLLPNHFSVLVNGSLYIEHVLSDDTNKYTCTGVNKNGEASAIFNVNVEHRPAAPQIEVVTLKPSAVQINWVSAGNGGFDITGFRLEMRNTSRWSTIDVPLQQRSYWFRHLACGQSYDMRMRTHNEERSSDYSDVITVKTLGGKPIANNADGLVRKVNNTFISLDLTYWSDNGCPITLYSISYTNVNTDKTILLGSISSSQRYVYLDDLDPASWYNIEITAHSTAGSTSLSILVSTLTQDGNTIAPLHQYEATEVKDKPAIALLVTLSVAAFVTLIVILACFFYCKRRRDLLHYKAANKSRHSMFSDTSDLDPHHLTRANFAIPRENMSGDSRVWLLNRHPISGGIGGINSALNDSDGGTPDMADVEFERPSSQMTKSVTIAVPCTQDKSPYGTFIYASARRSGDYESCTPTLSFARARLYKVGVENRQCEHNMVRDYCPYCCTDASESNLLKPEECAKFSTSKLQLKQYELSFGGVDEEFPPPPPEALHEYHCHEPVSKRCISHEFMRHTGAANTPAIIGSRPNTTGLHNRVDTPGRMSEYPSCLSSMATVSSNHEELLMAYHNSKVNPLGPILFESPRPLTSSLSPQSSDMTEPGIRLFTQSPPRPEESRQAVCEVPIYNTTIPSGCRVDHSSDTTDHEPRPRSTRHKSPHRRLYKRKNKRVANQVKSREASDELSTNSDENSTYGIPSGSSATSDKGYGTRNKSADESYKAHSVHKNKECRDLYEEEEKMSLVQTAVSTGETTPPTTQKYIKDCLPTEQEKLMSSSADTKILDRYYRTVSADPTEVQSEVLYTEDYTIV